MMIMKKSIYQLMSRSTTARKPHAGSRLYQVIWFISQNAYCRQHNANC